MVTPTLPGDARNVTGERRVISVLFCDVVGSTSLAARFDPEEWAEIMNEAFRLMIGPIEEYGGMVARLMGDGVLAFFGAPVAHEDDPQRAVLAGLGILNGIRAFASEFKQDYGQEFDVRVGINTGPVVVGEIGGGQSGEYTAMGDAINLAARMEQTAAPGTVQISDETYRLVAPLFDVWDLGGVAVKGKDEPIQAYRVLGLEPQPGRLRGLSGIRSPLIGRKRELGRLREALAGLRGNRSGICYLIGEAGLGKTRLIAELRDEWREQLVALSGDADPVWRGWTEFVAVSYGASRPYDVLKRQLRSFCGIRETDTPAVIHERLNALVSMYPAALHERIRHVFGRLLGDMAGGVALGEGEAFQRELRAVVEQMALAQTSHGPAVFVIDDVHWADVASLEILQSLLPLVRRAPVLFLFAMRPDWSAPGWQLYLEAQMEYPEYCASVYLEPLTAADSRALIRELLEHANAPERVLELIERKAEGNPFFVEETVRTLLDSGALRRVEGDLCWNDEADLERIAELIGVPGNVQALLTARIDQLDGPARQTLQLASVIGRSFPLKVLQRIAEQPAGALEIHLKRLGQADLVRPSLSGVETEYAFRHALTRDAAYETILIRQRRRYHRRVGEAIEALYADRLADEAPRLAYHFSECREWARAVHYYSLAGETAARLYANAEALEHYDQALSICHANPGVADDAQWAALYRQRGRVFEVAGRHDEALRNYEALEQLGVERDNLSLQLEGLTPQAVLYLTPTPFMDATRGRELADRILALAERSGRADAEAYGRWALLLLYINAEPDPAQAVVEGERALALAREQGLQHLEAFVLNDIGRAYAAHGDMIEAFTAFEQAYETWRKQDNEPMMADSLALWSQGLALGGDLDGAERAAAEGLDIGRRIGNLWAQAFNALPLGHVLVEKGRISEGLKLLRTSAHLAAQAGFQGPGAFNPVVVRWVLGTLGSPGYDLEALSALIAASEHEQDISLTMPFWQALMLFFDGDTAGAYDKIASLEMPNLAFAGIHTLYLTTIAVTLALDAGQPAEAVAIVDDMLATLQQYDMAAGRAEFLTLRGKAAQRLGHTEEALANLREAYAEAQRQGARRAEYLALAALNEAEPEPATAAEYRRLGREALRFIESHIEEPELRAGFLNQPDAQKLLADE